MHRKRWRKLKLSELTMNTWIDYGLIWLYIYIHKWFSLACLIPIPVFSLFSWFFYGSTCSKGTKSMKPNGNIITEWVEVYSLVWEKALFYREVICFLINNLFGNVFQKTPTLKRYLSSWKRHFLVWKFKENEVFIIPAYFNVLVHSN